ncbi:hypothetical protein C8Q80DRAFT_1124701 [Daedaleopsis nitida]|nr:hypothetical protein C8Q80DRAFT_1124701 [Daedaleopsis nitida]
MTTVSTWKTVDVGALMPCYRSLRASWSIYFPDTCEEEKVSLATQVDMVTTVVTLPSINDGRPTPSVRLYMSVIRPSIMEYIQERSPSDEEVYRYAGIPAGEGNGLYSLRMTTQGNPPQFCASLFCQLGIVGSSRRCMTIVEIIEAIEEQFSQSLMDRNGEKWRPRIFNALRTHAWFSHLACPSDVLDAERLWFIDKRS